MNSHVAQDTAPVVFVNGTGDVSGAEKVLLSLVELAVNRRHQVTVACPTGPLVSRLPEVVQHVPLPALVLEERTGPLGRHFGAARLLGRYLVAAQLLRKLPRNPNSRTVVNSLRALPILRLAGRHREAAWLVHDTVHSPKQRMLVRVGARGLRRVVAVSGPAAAPLRALGLPVIAKAHGVTWPVDAAKITLRHPPVVGCLALLTPWKGHTVLLDALALLPGVRLELAGDAFPTDAEYVRALHRRADKSDLRGRVRFLGHVDALRTMRGWDVAVSASTAPEAGPLALLEAMSLGLPVVGTDHGGTADFLAGDVGLLVPPGEVGALAQALHRALTDSEFRRASHQAGPASIATDHDSSKTLPAMLEALLAG